MPQPFWYDDATWKYRLQENRTTTTFELIDKARKWAEPNQEDPDFYYWQYLLDLLADRLEAIALVE